VGEPAKIVVDQRLQAVPEGAGQPALAGNLQRRAGHVAVVELIEEHGDALGHHVVDAGQTTRPDGRTARAAELVRGRLAELAEVDRLLARSRMVTLTGVGGCGKSRLALEAAAEMSDAYHEGVWWVDLAALGDPTLLPATVAATLSVKERPGADLAGPSATLRDASLLLVLDNCEHLVRECGALAEELLRGCPGVSVLATSREPLAVEGETTYTVPSLELPEEGDPRNLEDVESVRLFVERARQVSGEFRLTAASAEPVAEICRRLDEIPLAVELAAARSRLLTPAQVLAGLTDRFGLLTGGRRTALPRHRTLQASVDWSYQLLAQEERELLHRLSVFVGSFGLDAVRDVCCDGTIDRGDVLELLAHLVDKSLVVVEGASDGARYRLLETIRQYAADKLAATGDAPTVPDRHLDFYVRLRRRPKGRSKAPNSSSGWTGSTSSCPTCGWRGSGPRPAARSSRRSGSARRCGSSSSVTAT